MEARKNGLQLLVDKIAAMNPDSYPMVLTGDFNMHPGDASLSDLDKQMSSARKVAEKTDNIDTYNGWGSGSTDGSHVIDYIYVSGFKSVVEYRTVTDPYAGITYVSDHYPIISILEY